MSTRLFPIFADQEFLPRLKHLSITSVTPRMYGFETKKFFWGLAALETVSIGGSSSPSGVSVCELFSHCPKLNTIKLSPSSNDLLTRPMLLCPPKTSNTYIEIPKPEKGLGVRITEGVWKQDETDQKYLWPDEQGRSACRGTENVTTLDLSRTGVREVPGAGQLYCFPTLTTLLLDGNRIRSLPPAAFDHLPHLTNLSLRDNLLTVIGPDVFSAQVRARLLRLSLEGNHFRCGCDLLRFHRQFHFPVATHFLSGGTVVYDIRTSKI